MPDRSCGEKDASDLSIRLTVVKEGYRMKLNNEQILSLIDSAREWQCQKQGGILQLAAPKISHWKRQNGTTPKVINQQNMNPLVNRKSRKPCCDLSLITKAAKYSMQKSCYVSFKLLFCATQASQLPYSFYYLNTTLLLFQQHEDYVKTASILDRGNTQAR